jgi:hypothetical protein
MRHARRWGLLLWLSRAAQDARSPTLEHVATRDGVTAARVASPSREALLTQLRARLRAIESMNVNEPIDAALPDVGALVGSTRGVIVAALGAPLECALEQRTHCYGEPAFCVADDVPTPPPCQRDEDVYYAFYRLPEGTERGGPALLLRFDHDARCVLAEFSVTP